jgi:Flp pilus assembly pilin Flp
VTRTARAGPAGGQEYWKERRMKRLVRSAAGLLRRVYRDEQGANMIEYVLIIAAIALPLLALVLLYGKDIKDWVERSWSTVTGREDLSNK